MATTQFIISTTTPTIIIIISLLTPNTALITCNSKPPLISTTNTNKTTTYNQCNHLPTLNSILYYTYTPTSNHLSIAFTAPPLSPSGWAAVGLNPTDLGMVGAQTLLAFKPKPGPISVSTYDIKSYWAPLTQGPISYNVTGVSAQEFDGVITIFATWTLPLGERSVNLVWQVGPVVDGRPASHDFEQVNLESMMKIRLVVGSTGEPVTGGDDKGGLAVTPVTSRGVAVKGCWVIVVVAVVWGFSYVLLL